MASHFFRVGLKVVRFMYLKLKANSNCVFFSCNHSLMGMVTELDYRPLPQERLCLCDFKCDDREAVETNFSIWFYPDICGVCASYFNPCATIQLKKIILQRI